jgi:hypothetical protein
VGPRRRVQRIRKKLPQAILRSEIFHAELIQALPDWDVALPVEYGKNFAVRGPSAVHVSLP